MERHDIPKVYRDYEEAFEDNIDIVGICLPHYLHAPVTIAACGRSKYVLAEKTIARYMGEAEQMAEAVKAAGVKLMVGQCEQFMAGGQKIKELIEGGTLDKISLTELVYLQYFPTFTAQDWARTWRETGGGCGSYEALACKGEFIGVVDG